MSFRFELKLMRNQVLLCLAVVLGMLATWLHFDSVDANLPDEEQSFESPLTASGEGFAKVLEPRSFQFPEDHGAHNDYRSEWWYFTGNLSDRSGRRFGYQLTFFRFALVPEVLRTESAWRDNQMYMAHFAISDVEARRFHFAERFSRAGLSLAGTRSVPFKVWLHDWSAAGSENDFFPLRLKAEHPDFAVDLTLTAEKPLVLQGDRGFSQKSDRPGNASYYYSYTRLASQGRVSVLGQDFAVSGNSWMDREWSTSALSRQQAGWDWFSLQLSDGSELMIYQLRLKNGGIDPHSSGTLILADGSQIGLKAGDATIDVLDAWTSPHSKRRYPSRWRLSIPKHRLQLAIEPLLDDQELNLAFRYWEGAVRIEGNRQGRSVSGFGYVELTGY